MPPCPPVVFTNPAAFAGSASRPASRFLIGAVTRWTANAGERQDGFRFGLRHFELASIESIKTRR
jgi:hypothetical protein